MSCLIKLDASADKTLTYLFDKTRTYLSDKTPAIGKFGWGLTLTGAHRYAQMCSHRPTHHHKPNRQHHHKHNWRFTFLDYKVPAPKNGCIFYYIKIISGTLCQKADLYLEKKYFFPIFLKTSQIKYSLKLNLIKLLIKY